MCSIWCTSGDPGLGDAYRSGGRLNQYFKFIRICTINIELTWEPKIIGVKNGIYQVELDEGAYDKKTYAQIDSLFIRNKFSANQEPPEIEFKFYFRITLAGPLKTERFRPTIRSSFKKTLTYCFTSD